MRQSSFRSVPKTGVIFVTHEAEKCGHGREKGWANLGQGAPETEDIPGQSPRILQVKMNAKTMEYAPVGGAPELREAVANFYNELYRRDKKSKYTYENVCIASGGRTGLSRIAAALGNINIGHFIPDYTAYEELLYIFKAFNPIPILLKKENHYRISAEELSVEIQGRGLGALLISNPHNPTGQVIHGEELKKWVSLAKNLDCTFIMDEFYSHYYYAPRTPPGLPISAAAFVEDVNEDPMVIIDGPTKNWRYPGWRISWTLAPKEMIDTLMSVGSFLDGGPVHALQLACVSLLDPQTVLQDACVLQKHFQQKRDFFLKELSSLDLQMSPQTSQGTFYCWADLSHLPRPLREGTKFFEEGLKEKVITVPGIYFDVNPGKRRSLKHSLYNNFTRISFGPPQPVLERGIESLKKVIKKF